MVLMGYWPLLTSIMGIKLINFISLLMKSRRETVMLSLGEGMTSLTTIPEKNPHTIPVYRGRIGQLQT